MEKSTLETQIWDGSKDLISIEQNMIMLIQLSRATLIDSKVVGVCFCTAYMLLATLLCAGGFGLRGSLCASVNNAT